MTFPFGTAADPATSFHPKAYLFSSTDGAAATAFVGSNNLSASGIAGGIEWAIGADQAAHLLAAFEQLWSDPRSRPLTHDLLADYRRNWRPTTPAAGVIPEPLATPPTPRPVQREALTALEQTRLDRFRRGLVVMGTGLGKTWLAAFDTSAVMHELDAAGSGGPGSAEKTMKAQGWRGAAAAACCPGMIAGSSGFLVAVRGRFLPTGGSSA